MMWSKKLIIGQKYVTSDRDVLHLLAITELLTLHPFSFHEMIFIVVYSILE